MMLFQDFLMMLLFIFVYAATVLIFTLFTIIGVLRVL